VAADKNIKVKQDPGQITFDKKTNYKVGNSGKSELNESIPAVPKRTRSWAKVPGKKKMK